MSTLFVICDYVCLSFGSFVYIISLVLMSMLAFVFTNNAHEAAQLVGVGSSKLSTKLEDILTFALNAQCIINPFFQELPFIPNLSSSVMCSLRYI